MKLLKYSVAVSTINRGTEHEPDMETVLQQMERYADEEHFERSLAVARKEAYNGEVTVEEVAESVTAPTQLDRVEAQGVYTAMMTGTLLDFEEE